MEKVFEKLELKDDFMFGVVMRNPEYCKPFLETILGVRISRIEYLSSQKTIDLSADAKGVRLDVYVEDGKGTVYNVEMQTTPQRNLPKRSRYYQGMIDLNILEKGVDYAKMKRSFIIFICTFDMFGHGRHVYTFENRCIQDLDLPLGDETTKIILNTKGTLDDVSPEMKRLLDYIDGQEPSDDFTRELDEAVNVVRENKERRLEYMTLYMKYQEKYEDGKAEGVREGLERGKEEGNIEKLIMQICKKCRKNKTIEEIADDLEEEVSAIEPICRIAEEFAPEYDWQKVKEKVLASIPL